jgi:hypothetical protein
MKRPDVWQGQVNVSSGGGSYLEAGFLYVVPGKSVGESCGGDKRVRVCNHRIGPGVTSTVIMGHTPTRSGEKNGG